MAEEWTHSPAFILLPIVSGPGAQGQAETCNRRRRREVVCVLRVSARPRRIGPLDARCGRGGRR